MLPKESADLCIHRGNRTGQYQTKTKSWEGGLKTFRIQLPVTEVSLVEMETGPSSRKGLCGQAPKVWKYSVRQRGEVYSLLEGAQNVIDGSRACCSVIFTGQEQGESS